MAAVRERTEHRRSSGSEASPSDGTARADPRAALLGLMRAAGNQATGRMLARYYDENGKWVEGKAPEGYVEFKAGNQIRYRKPPAAAAAPLTTGTTVTKTVPVPAVATPAAVATGPSTAEPPREDYTTEWRIDTTKLRYSQDSIDKMYGPEKDPGSITTAAIEARKRPGWFDEKFKDALQITKRGGRYISIDNRRLWIAKHAGLPSVRVTWAPPARVSQREFSAGKEGAGFIQVRGLKRSEMGSLPILEPPASQKMDAKLREKYM